MAQQDKKSTLAMISRLAKLEISDPDTMANSLDAVLRYVGQLEDAVIDAPETPDEQRLRPEESEATAEPVSSDRKIVFQNMPARDELGVWVPKFVRKKP